MNEHEAGNSTVGDQLKKISDHLTYLEKKIDQILAQSQSQSRPSSGGFQPRRPGGFGGRPDRGGYSGGGGYRGNNSYGRPQGGRDGGRGGQDRGPGRSEGRAPGYHKKASY